MKLTTSCSKQPIKLINPIGQGRVSVLKSSLVLSKQGLQLHLYCTVYWHQQHYYTSQSTSKPGKQWQQQPSKVESRGHS